MQNKNFHKWSIKNGDYLGKDDDYEALFASIERREKILRSFLLTVAASLVFLGFFFLLQFFAHI